MDKLQLIVKSDSYEQTPKFAKIWQNKPDILIQDNKEIRNIPHWIYNVENKFEADLNYSGLNLRFNPNKISGIRPALDVIEYRQIQDSIQEVNELINESGLVTDLWQQSKMYRIDNCYDFEPSPNRVYNDYVPALMGFDGLGVPQSKKGYCKNTFYNGNKTNKIVIYDKKEQSKLDYEVIRFEKRTYKIREPLSKMNEAYYQNFRLKDKAQIIKSFFESIPMALDKNSIESQILSIVTALLDNGVGKATIEKTVGIHAINLSLEVTNINAKQFCKRPRADRKLYGNANGLKNDINKYKNFPTEYLLDLYNELKSKFAEVA